MIEFLSMLVDVVPPQFLSNPGSAYMDPQREALHIDYEVRPRFDGPIEVTFVKSAAS